MSPAAQPPPAIVPGLASAGAKLRMGHLGRLVAPRLRRSLLRSPSTTRPRSSHSPVLVESAPSVRENLGHQPERTVASPVSSRFSSRRGGTLAYAAHQPGDVFGHGSADGAVLVDADQHLALRAEHEPDSSLGTTAEVGGLVVPGVPGRARGRSVACGLRGCYPFGRLAGDAGNEVEVLAEVQDGEAGEFCDGGDEQVGYRGARCRPRSASSVRTCTARSSMAGVRYCTGIADTGGRRSPASKSCPERAE